MPNANEKKVTMQTGYFNAAWQDIKNSPGWFGKLVVLSLVSLIPIFGWLVVLGYLYGWARQIVWDVHSPMPQHIFGNEDGKLYSRGLFALVIGFVCMLAPWLLEFVWGIVTGVGAAWSGRGHAGGIFMFMGLTTAVFSLIILAAFFFSTLFAWVGSMRMTVYGRLSAGFQFGKIWAMIRHDFSGLLRILGMAILVSLVVGIVISVVIFVVTFVGMLLAFVIAGGSASMQYAMHSSQPGPGFWSMLFTTGGIVFALVAVCGVLSMAMAVFIEMMVVRALGYWMRQFDVRSWRGQEDPMPFELTGFSGQPSVAPADQAPMQQPPYVPPTGQPPMQG